jgi:tRNA-specific 2-thiouridylase
LLKIAKYKSKDQSYFLYSLTQEQLKHVLFPVGNLEKQSEVRVIAEKNNFKNFCKPDSQDICFVGNKNYYEFIKDYLQKEIPAGNFVGLDGKILGGHSGTVNYTVGQRKHLGISFGKPMYVHSIQAEKNQVILCCAEDLYKKKFTVGDVNIIPYKNISDPMRLTAKTSSKQTPQPTTIIQVEDDKIIMEFDIPQRSVNAGQTAVFYDGDTVVGGGTIIN